MDVLVGILKMVMQRRPELKVLLLSSYEEKKLQAHFEAAPLLKVPNHTFPVEVFHAQDAERDYLKAAVRTTIQIHTSEPDGDILLFLPHEDEIDLACQMLRKEAVHISHTLVVRAIYVGLPLMDLQQAFEPAPAGRMGGGEAFPEGRGRLHCGRNLAVHRSDCVCGRHGPGETKGIQPQETGDVWDEFWGFCWGLVM